jgi:hypothetical protein
MRFSLKVIHSSGFDLSSSRTVSPCFSPARGPDADQTHVATSHPLEYRLTNALLETGRNHPLLEIHRILMDRSPRPELGGIIREQQNRIGGSSYNPCSAVFVPPPADQVHDLVAALIEYVNDNEHSHLA